MSFSLHQIGNSHEEIILVGEGYHRDNPYIPSPSHKEILLERISSLTKRKLIATFKDSHEFFSSSKRKSSRGKNPIGRGNGGEQ